MERMWHEEWLGKPWSGVPNPPETFNCGEFVRYVYKRDLGHECLPVPVPDARKLKDCVKAMKPDYFGLVPAELPLQDRDAVFMARRYMMDHCGMIVLLPNGEQGILHCSQQGGVQLSTFLEMKMQGYTSFSFWRSPKAVKHD